jgi:hypothetical protein
MQYENRLYLLLHPSAALIGSQYGPEDLARHYTVGPTRHYRGKIIFAELDVGFRNPYFPIDQALSELRPHEDGRPKATKFVSSYRVLEHVDFGALGSLYLSTAEGYLMQLEAAPYSGQGSEDGPSIYAEITPLHMLVLSMMDFVEFGAFITDPASSIGAPRFFYTQLNLDLREFLQSYERNPFMPPPIPNLHPSVLRDAIHELQTVGYKKNKGLSLRSNLDAVSYRLIRSGFMFASREERRFYPMPSAKEIEKRSLKFWRSM